MSRTSQQASRRPVTAAVGLVIGAVALGAPSAALAVEPVPVEQRVSATAPGSERTPSVASQGLKSGEVLKAGQKKVSAQGRFALTQLADGNLVLIKRSTGKAVWASGTHGNPGAYTHMLPDGNLVVAKNQKAIFSTRSHGNDGATALVQDDGNLVIYDGQKPVWSILEAIEHATPDEKIPAGRAIRSVDRSTRLYMQDDGNLVLYRDGKAVWATMTDGNPGAWAKFQADGNLVVNSSSGKVLWNSRTFGHQDSSLVVQNDGNMVIYAADDTPLWSTDTQRR